MSVCFCSCVCVLVCLLLFVYVFWCVVTHFVVFSCPFLISTRYQVLYVNKENWSKVEVLLWKKKRYMNRYRSGNIYNHACLWTTCYVP